MNLKEQIREQASMDSRRVATGLECVIISDVGDLKGLLRLLDQFGMLPDHSRIPPESGYDSRSGVAMVIPKGQREFIVDQLTESRKRIEDKKHLVDSNTITRDMADEEEVFIKENQEKLFRSIREHVILVTLNNHSQYGVPNARDHYVYVHTREQSPPNAEIVPILEYNNPLSQKWTKE